MADKRYERGTELRSLKWGICVLDRPSYMRPGTKVCVRNLGTNVAPCWRPVDDFEHPTRGVRVVDGETGSPADGDGGK